MGQRKQLTCKVTAQGGLLNTSSGDVEVALVGSRFKGLWLYRQPDESFNDAFKRLLVRARERDAVWLPRWP